MQLTIIEDTRLSEALSVFGIVVFEDGSIVGANKDLPGKQNAERFILIREFIMRKPMAP